MKDRFTDGGPAFPVLMKAGEVARSDAGMSLRDWHAGQALAGQLASMTPGNIDPAFASHVAKQAYLVADAMLAERAKAFIGAPLTTDKLDQLLEGGE